jgi:hypothetical protein
MKGYEDPTPECIEAARTSEASQWCKSVDRLLCQFPQDLRRGH